MCKSAFRERVLRKFMERKVVLRGVEVCDVPAYGCEAFAVDR